MLTTRLSTKGQVVLPKSLLTAYHWHPGLEFLLEGQNEAVILRPIQKNKTYTLKDLMGCANYKGPKKSLKNMEEGVRKGAKESHACR